MEHDDDNDDDFGVEEDLPGPSSLDFINDVTEEEEDSGAYEAW